MAGNPYADLMAADSGPEPTSVEPSACWRATSASSP